MCHLTEELSKASDVENPLSSEKSNRFVPEFSVLYFEDVHNYNLDVFYELTTGDNLAYLNLYSYASVDFIFHPPCKI